MANIAADPDIPRTVDALNAAVVYPQQHKIQSQAVEFQSKPSQTKLARALAVMLLDTHLFVIELLREDRLHYCASRL